LDLAFWKVIVLLTFTVTFVVVAGYIALLLRFDVLGKRELKNMTCPKCFQKGTLEEGMSGRFDVFNAGGGGGSFQNYCCTGCDAKWHKVNHEPLVKGYFCDEYEN